MSHISKNYRNCKKHPNDIIYTHRHFSKEIIDLIPLETSDIVLDPFLGDGSFYDQYPDYVTKDWCEIEKGRDFFEYDQKVDWIISNPPFSKLTKIIEKACQLCDKGFCFIIMTTAITPYRMEIIESYGFKLTHLEIFDAHKMFNFGFPMFVLVFDKIRPSIRRLKQFRY